MAATLKVSVALRSRETGTKNLMLAGSSIGLQSLDQSSFGLSELPVYEMEDLKQIRHAHRLILFHWLMNPGRVLKVVYVIVRLVL